LPERRGIGGGNHGWLSEAIVVRPVVIDDAGGYETGAGRYAAGKLAKGCTGSDLGDPGSMSYYIRNRRVVDAGIDIDEFLDYPAAQCSVVRHEPAIDYPDGNAGPGVPLLLRRVGVARSPVGSVRVSRRAR
jgi:hypothetical protein